MFADLLYKEVGEKKDSGITFEMKFSMLEIYNEVARDLLVAKGKKGGLKIRQHPKRGFYGNYLLDVIERLGPGTNTHGQIFGSGVCTDHC